MFEKLEVGFSYVVCVFAVLSVFYLGIVMFKAYNYKHDLSEEQGIQIGKLKDKVEEGYDLYLDGCEITGAEKDLVVSNIENYLFSFDDATREITVTKKRGSMTVYEPVYEPAD